MSKYLSRQIYLILYIINTLLHHDVKNHQVGESGGGTELIK